MCVLVDLQSHKVPLTLLVPPWHSHLCWALLERASWDRTRGDGFTLKKRVRQKFFMVKHSYRLPREVVDDPSLETFEVRLDRGLSKLL